MLIKLAKFLDGLALPVKVANGHKATATELEEWFNSVEKGNLDHSDKYYNDDIADLHLHFKWDKSKERWRLVNPMETKCLTELGLRRAHNERLLEELFDEKG